MRQALAAGSIAFAYLAAGASSAHFWLDSGELGSAGWALGVMHPPGAPGYGLLLRAATLLPVGSLGFRMALVSSLMGAVVVALLVAILRRREAPPLVTWGAALWVLCGLTFLRQARVVEIYTFGAALSMIVLWGLDPAVRGAERTSRRLCAVAAASWGAWCFGDLRLALAPLLLVVWVVALLRGRPWAGWAPLVAVLATAVVLALPLASARNPDTDWGDPETFGALWDHLAARSIRDSYADEILPASGLLWLENFERTLARLAEDLGPPGLALVGLALIATWVCKKEERRAMWPVAAAMSWFVLVELVYAVGINPMGEADRQTGLVLAPMAALLVADQLRRALAERRRLQWVLPPLVWTLVVLPAALVGVPDLFTTVSWAPHAWVRAALDRLPPGTLLLTQSDDLAAGVTAARVLEGARPDVISIPAQHLYKPMPDAAAARPREAVLWEAAGRQSDETARIVAAMNAHRGPLALEYPAAGLFEAVPFWPERGRLPVAVAGPGSADPRLDPLSIDQEIDVWSSQLTTTVDRRRLALAIFMHARGRVQARGDLRGAAAALQASLTRVDDRHAGALVTLGALHDRLGNPDRAIALTRLALEVEPDRHLALTNLALYLSRDPETLDEADAFARRAVALRPWRADGWLRLSSVRALAGDVEGARQAEQRARAEASAQRGDPS